MLAIFDLKQEVVSFAQMSFFLQATKSLTIIGEFRGLQISFVAPFKTVFLGVVYSNNVRYNLGQNPENPATTYHEWSDSVGYISISRLHLVAHGS